MGLSYQLRNDSLSSFTPLYASTRVNCLALKIKPPGAIVHCPAIAPTMVSCRKAKSQALCLAPRGGDPGSTAAGFSRADSPARPGTHRARAAVPLCRRHRSPREPEDPPRKNRGEEKVGRRRGDTHPPRKQPTGRGGWGPGARLGRKTAWGFRNAAAAAPGLGLPPLLCFGATAHVTISHETRICPLPRAAAQQIAAARDPGGGSAERARTPRLRSASAEAGRARASRYSGDGLRRLQFRLTGARPRGCQTAPT